MKQIAVWVAAVAAALGAPDVGAATFSFTAQERFVSLEDVARAGSERVEAADFADFDANLGGDQVTQNSSLAATRILAGTHHDVTAYVLALSGDVDEHFIVESSFAIDFSVDEPSAYTLEAELAVLGYVTDVHEFFAWFDNQLVLEASLVGPGGSLLDLSFDLQIDCAFQADCSFEAPLSQSGVLEPGSYTLIVRSFAIAEANIICVGFLCSNRIPYNSASDGTARVDLQIVPEPDGTTALATCIAVLGVLARRRLVVRRSVHGCAIEEAT